MREHAEEETALPARPRLTRAQKAAVVLCLLGRDTARSVFESLGEDELQRFAQAMAGLGQIDEATVGEVVAEFLGEVGGGASSVRGGVEKARALLAEHFDAPVVERLFGELEGGGGGDVWARLGGLEPKAVAGMLGREHPQSAAVIVSRLPPEFAGKVAGQMSAEAVSKIFLAIRRMRWLDGRLVAMIGENVAQALLQGGGQGPAHQPPEQVAAIMSNTRSDLRDRVMGLMESADAAFAEETRRSMFTFEDIPERVRGRDIALLVRSVENEVLLAALAGTDEATQAARTFILGNISTRFAEQIGEEIAELGELPPREVERAQRAIVARIQALVKAGEIRLIRPDDAAEED